MRQRPGWGALGEPLGGTPEGEVGVLTPPRTRDHLLFALGFVRCKKAHARNAGDLWKGQDSANGLGPGAFINQLTPAFLGLFRHSFLCLFESKILNEMISFKQMIHYRLF